MYPDRQSGLIKALNEMDEAVRDIQYQLAEQRGIKFKTCLPQGHSAHGKVERIIRSLKESMDTAGVKSERLSATSWTVIAKGIQNCYNSLPIGVYYRISQVNVSLLRILTPNMLKGKVSTRAPAGLFEVPSNVNKLIENIYPL